MVNICRKFSKKSNKTKEKQLFPAVPMLISRIKQIIIVVKQGNRTKILMRTTWRVVVK